MTRTRVLFDDIPRMLSEILIHELSSHDDIDVLAQGASTVDADDTGELVRRANVGAVLTSSPDGTLPPHCHRLIYQFPSLRVVVLTEDGRTASLYRLVLDQTVWRDVAPADVAAALRDPDATPPGAE